MATRKPPILDVAVLCMEDVRDANDLVFALNEPLHTVIIAPNDDGHLEAPEFVLFVQMTDWEANGTYDFAVEARSDLGIIIPGTPTSRISVTFASHYYPFSPFEHVFQFDGLVFPDPGVYHFHVMCGLASLSVREECARPPKLHVVQRESGGRS